MNIDRKDERILAALLENARDSLTQIGKKVGLSRENVHYRIKGLEKGIIRNHLALIDPYVLGYSHYVCFLHLKNVDTKQEQSFIEFLHQHKNISWVGTLAGRWSLTFDLYARNEQDADRVLNELFEAYRGWVGEYQVLTVQQSTYYFEKLLGSDHISRSVLRSSHSLDEIDLRILRELNADAQSSYAHLSREIDLSANAIRRRIKQLQDAGFILGYTISIDQQALGLQWYGIQIRMVRSDETARLQEFLRSHPDVSFTYTYTRRGLHDFDIGIAVTGPEGVKSFISQLREHFGDVLRITDTFTVLDEHSSHNLPEAVFE